MLPGRAADCDEHTHTHLCKSKSVIWKRDCPHQPVCSARGHIRERVKMNTCPNLQTEGMFLPQDLCSGSHQLTSHLLLANVFICMFIRLYVQGLQKSHQKEALKWTSLSILMNICMCKCFIYPYNSTVICHQTCSLLLISSPSEGDNGPFCFPPPATCLVDEGGPAHTALLLLFPAAVCSRAE